MLVILRIKTCLGLLAVVAIPASAAIEPWADRTLSVTNGLAVWLDASREGQPPASPAPAAGAEISSGTVARGVWRDASGNKRDAIQADARAQPMFGAAAANAFSFDGKSHYFVVQANGLKWPEATVVVCARVKANSGSSQTLVAGSAAGAANLAADFGIHIGGRVGGSALETLNIDGAGITGKNNMLLEPVGVGAPFVLFANLGADAVSASVSGMQTALRPRAKGEAIHAERIFIGARASFGATGLSSSDAQDFFHGEILDVLIYDRSLTTTEIRAVRTYLESKLAARVATEAAAGSRAAPGLATAAAIKDPLPTIQPLIPGFTTRKLPVQLTNINFLRYRPDGRLYAGAYNGKIYLLRDTDGDGLEDQADLYYENKDVSVIMGMALTPPDYPRGEGVFIVSRGKALLLLDGDRDGKADEAITVAEGWPPPERAAGGVSDSLGIAVARDGSVFFGIGADNFTNAYRLDPATGQAGYRLAGERGTIQRVAPDFSRRETIATGIRFTVGLAFNREGELFATEQEGATWLSNGNALDELLHIQLGRHYGFPPMHPRHLPSVVDEPSVFDYGPQHQSTVGLWFNEPLSEGGRSFGPGWWRGDALVAAMSRGKIYRTKLIKTAAGYVAKNETIAQLQNIVIDQAVAPGGALTVTLHSGKPDWGTGPRGAGELWRIVPDKVLPPQPVLAWSENRQMLRVAFDQPLSDKALAAMQGKVRVVQGRHAQAGDRFETMRPGYQVVKNQIAAPRYDVPVLGVVLSENRRTLMISTPERTAAVPYAISIEADVFGISPAAPYGGQVDLQADLSGLEAEWRTATGTPVRAWLPHLDFSVARALLEPGAVGHDFFSILANPGTVTLRGQLDLGLMLYPEVQSGSTIDWSYPPEKVTLTLEARRPFRAQLGSESVSSQATEERHRTMHTVTTQQGTWLPFSVVYAQGAGDPAPTVTWTTDRSSTPRPLPLRRFLVAYARPMETPPGSAVEEPAQIVGGNWIRGQALFQAVCASCHQMRGNGAHVGPDLSHLAHRDYESVLRDIRDPNAAINPEHVAYTFKLKNGSEFTGVLLSETADTLSVALVGEGIRKVSRADVLTREQLPVSLMPPGLDQALGEEKFRDLMRYLLVPGLEPAAIMQPNPPEPRPRREIESLLAAAPAPSETETLAPLRIVLCAADKDRGHMAPGVHDYPLWRERWSKLLSLAPAVTIETADGWPTADQWARADVVVSFHNNPAWRAAKGSDLDAFLARGGGLVFLHYAVRAGTADRRALAQRLGHAWGEAGNVFRIGPTPLQFKPHAITAGFPLDRPVAFIDETYAKMIGSLDGWTVLATSAEPSGDEPQVWLRETGGGRVFVCIPGHSTWTHDDPLYRVLVFRGMLWTARQPLGRFNDLATVGARLAP